MVSVIEIQSSYFNFDRFVEKYQSKVSVIEIQSSYFNLTANRNWKSLTVSVIEIQSSYFNNYDFATTVFGSFSDRNPK